jgi:hypothetical protein
VNWKYIEYVSAIRIYFFIKTRLTLLRYGMLNLLLTNEKCNQFSNI